MKAVITVVGKDRVGILASVANACARVNANVLDVSQTILADMFTMTMIVDMEKATTTIASWSEQMREFGKQEGLDIRVMAESIFDAMHRV